MHSIDTLWDFLFSSDKSPKKSKEFEASIIIDARHDEKFINTPDVTESLSDEEEFEILSNDTNI